MTPQSTLKLPATEIPVGVLDMPAFWALVACGLAAIWLWRRKP